jgi:hypothetical protein
VANYVRKENAVSVANNTLNERVKSPAITVAQGIVQVGSVSTNFQIFAPIVDYFEVAVNLPHQ